MKFVDEVQFTVASGKGGPGCVSFRRESMVARGGPDGGEGGKGGDVIFRVNPQSHSLLDLRYKKKYRAGNGLPGEGANRSGSNGEDLIIDVPPGTMICTPGGRVLHDLSGEGDLVFLKGGIGGKGNTFYKSSINQAPSVAQKGLPGQEQEVLLQLKLLADVGLIGLPNAGKSTLISVISAAKPKIADYPFTTLVPNLGVVRYGDEGTFVVADIPGLISGAHEGVGLGIQFLKHIERTRLFVHLIDMSEMSGKDPLEAYQEVRQELLKYDEDHQSDDKYNPLGERLEFVVLNKVDSVDDERVQQVTQQFKEQGIDPWVISAVTGKRVKELVLAMGQAVLKGES